MYLGFSGEVLTLSRQLNVVDAGTVIVSHYLARKATGNVAFVSIVLYKFIFSISTGMMWGMNHAILLMFTSPARAASALKIASTSVFLTSVSVCFNP